MSENVNNNILSSKPEWGSPLKTERFRTIRLCDVFKLVYKLVTLNVITLSIGMIVLEHSADPDQKPLNVAFEQGLHCLPLI